jgi:quercetin dioxygenase-like cupin family protein
VLKRIIPGVVAAVFVVASVLIAQGTATEKPKAAAKPAAKKAVFMPAGDMAWAHTPGAPPDVMGVTLWGSPEKGPYGGIQKFPAGFSAPLHTHSSDLRAVVISGTFLVGPEGGPDNKLPAGSYEFIPSTFKHTTKCDTASECVVFIEANGKFDVKVVGEKAPAKK